MKNIFCKQPNFEHFEYSAFYCFKAKGAIWLAIMMMILALPFAHYLLNIAQWWTAIIFIFLFTFVSIPYSWYMKNLYRYLISSLVGSLGLTMSLYYAGTLFLIYAGLNIPVTWIVVFAILFFIIINIVEVYAIQKHLEIYQDLLRKSIKHEKESGKPKLYIEDWVQQLEQASAKFSTGKAWKIGIIIGIPVLIAGAFGGPLVPAKILLNNGQEHIVSWIVSLSLIAGATVFTMYTANEFLKIVSAWQLQDNDITTD